MNRIEERLATLQAKKEKAFITYLTAGLPNMEATAAIVKAQEEAGTDIIDDRQRQKRRKNNRNSVFRSDCGRTGDPAGQL